MKADILYIDSIVSQLPTLVKMSSELCGDVADSISLIMKNKPTYDLSVHLKDIKIPMYNLQVVSDVVCAFTPKVDVTSPDSISEILVTPPVMASISEILVTPPVTTGISAIEVLVTPPIVTSITTSEMLITPPIMSPMPSSEVLIPTYTNLSETISLAKYNKIQALSEYKLNKSLIMLNSPFIDVRMTRLDLINPIPKHFNFYPWVSPSHLGISYSIFMFALKNKFIFMPLLFISLNLFMRNINITNILEGFYICRNNIGTIAKNIFSFALNSTSNISVLLALLALRF